jgi:hypothetical protein
LHTIVTQKIGLLVFTPHLLIPARGEEGRREVKGRGKQ